MKLSNIFFAVVVIALISSFFLGLGWTWIVTVCAFFLGMGMMLYLAYIIDRNKKSIHLPYRATKLQERIGYCGAVITLLSIVVAMVHFLYWILL